jgi:hypothetical protein
MKSKLTQPIPLKALTSTLRLHNLRAVTLTQKEKEVHSKNPQLAEQIANEAFGQSYQSLLDKGSKESKPDIESLVEKAVEKRLKTDESQKTQQEIDEALTEFFIKNEISPNDLLFRKVNEEFSEYPVSNKKQAKTVLKGILTSLSSKEEVPTNNAPNMRSASLIGKAGKKTSKISDTMANIMGSTGIDPNKFREFEKKK